METKTLTPNVQPGARLRARLLTVAESFAELDRRDRFTNDDEIRRYNERLRARLQLASIGKPVNMRVRWDENENCTLIH